VTIFEKKKNKNRGVGGDPNFSISLILFFQTTGIWVGDSIPTVGFHNKWGQLKKQLFFSKKSVVILRVKRGLGIGGAGGEKGGNPKQ